ncbi:MAG: cytidylate kinase-like family protein [Lachnospiraceae bacterium]|nr:cytidylate kinase-like family protein [Lachnospiraceae bacterium]
MNRIITISRQFGSGGRTIGKEVAKELGIPCYDKELIEKIAEETGYASEYIMEEAEYAPNTSGFAYSFLGRGSDGLSNADRIWFAQRKVILNLAEKENCVIVGRCADYLLKDKADCLNVFVYAAPEFRAQRIVKLYGESPVAPLKRLADKDKKRKLNYKYFTEQEWGKTQNYHMCLDSGYLGIENVVDLIGNTYIGNCETSSQF